MDDNQKGSFMIDGLINDAESALYHGKLDKSLILFSQACIKIIHFLKNQSTFEQVDGRKYGIQRIKSIVPDNRRLFNLARLCLTEIESIINNEIDLNDLDTDDDPHSNDDDGDLNSKVEDDPALKHLATPSEESQPIRPSTNNNIKGNANNTSLEASVLDKQYQHQQIIKPSVGSSGRTTPSNKQLSPQLYLTTTQQSEYIPIIPASPLSQCVLSWTQYQAQATKELQQLQQLRDPASLAATKRHLENLSLIKEKLAVVKQQIQETQTKTILDFTVKSLAATIAGYDCDLTMNINMDQVNTFIKLANEPTSPNLVTGSPPTLRVPLDFGMWLTRLVQSSILSSDTINNRAKIIQHWVEVGSRLFELKDHHGLYSVVTGLRSFPLTLITKSWRAVSRKHTNILNELDSIFHRYNQTMNESRTPFIPALHPLILQKYQIDLCNAIENFISGSKYDPDVKERTPIVSHYMLSQKWIGDEEIKLRASKPEVKK